MGTITENIIEISDLSFSYPPVSEKIKADEILHNVSLNIKRGEFVAVLGHNGSGKSTLAKLMNGILVPTSGKITVDGIDTADDDTLFDLRRRVGMVFQNPDNQIVATIVEEDVAFALENLGVEPVEMRRRIDEALKTVGMYEFREHAPHQLSGGQKQRVAIAGIIAMMPDCIVLDEPTAMLDPVGRREVIKTIRRLNKDKGITMVLITHYMNEASKADRVVVIDGGSIAMDGKPSDIFCRVEELRKLGLDVPQPTALLHEMNSNGFCFDEHIINDEECADAILKYITDNCV